MSMLPRRPRDRVFVIRIWPDEAAEHAAGRWRGQVTDLASRDRHYFTNYGELCEFLDGWTVRQRSGRATLRSVPD